MGEVCDDCRRPMVVSQECKRCGKTFHAIARQAATRVSDGVKVDIGDFDHYTGHDCRPKEGP
jgi:hypothetical protein